MGGKAMSLRSRHEFLEIIDDQSLAMMTRVLDNECACRGIRRDSIQGEEFARVILHAFISGMTEEGDLRVLARNLRN
jgi:hypothetical protein